MKIQLKKGTALCKKVKALAKKEKISFTQALKVLTAVEEIAYHRATNYVSKAAENFLTELSTQLKLSKFSKSFNFDKTAKPS